VKEIILGYRIEMECSEGRDNLYLYLNQIYLGEGGLTASKRRADVFRAGSPPLRLAEEPSSRGWRRRPTRYSPGATRPGEEEQRYVLRRMAEVGFIGEEEAEKAYNARLALAPPPTFRSRAAYCPGVRPDLLQENTGRRRSTRTR